MKKAVAVVAVIAVLVGGMLVLMVGVSDSEATSGRAICIAQNGNAAELTVEDLDSGDTVVWDLGDGRIVIGPSVETTYSSGFYFVQVIIISSTGATEHLQRGIGVYDSTPATSVARNDEYRYCVYTGSDPSLTVKDSSGRLASWLTYDAGHRIVTGVPRDTGTYHVWLNDRYWSIDVTDAPLSAPWVRFSASITDRTISASPTGSAADPVSRYSWSLTALDGSLVSAYEGRTLSMTADSGIYILKLQQVGPSGSASYSQIVQVMSVSEPEPDEPDEPISIWTIALGAASAVLLLASAASRSIWPAGAALLCATVAILMVIKWI